MLMQQIKVMSPKCLRYQGSLELLVKSKFACFSRKYEKKHCVIDNKLLKIYDGPDKVVLEGVLDFDLLNCDT
jgi:hypothetical protein